LNFEHSQRISRNQYNHSLTTIHESYNSLLAMSNHLRFTIDQGAMWQDGCAPANTVGFHILRTKSGSGRASARMANRTTVACVCCWVWVSAGMG